MTGKQPPRLGSVLGLGCWVFGGAQWGGQEDEDSRSAMAASLANGITHFDTANAYGGGRSEQVVGAFLQGRRDDVYLASKFNVRGEATPEQAVEGLDASLERLGTDRIDLYYLHWPKKGKDMRPAVEGLERLRQAGKITHVGVSNFSVEQLEQVAEAGRIDALQICYNLFWRYPERDLLPYCKEHGVAVVTYSSIAQGILTGKFGRTPTFKEGDSRSGMLLFDDDVWPHVYDGVEALKGIAREVGRPLQHLAIQWVAAQPAVETVLVGARTADQAEENARAMAGPVGQDVIDRMTAVSDDVMTHVPDVGNIFRYYP